MKRESAIQLRGGIHEVRRREAFREGPVDGGQLGAGLVVATLLLPKAAEAHRGAQLQRLRRLGAGDRDGLTETGFCVRRIVRIQGQQELSLESVHFRFVDMYSGLRNY